MAKQEKWAIANERTTTGFTASYVCVSKKTYSHVSRARISPIHSPCSFTSVMVFYFHLFIESLYSLFCGIFRLIFICLWVRHMWSALLKYYISVCHSHRKCESMICFDILYHRRNIRPTSLASYGIWWRQQLQQQRTMMWIVIIKIIVSARDTQKCACVVCVVTVMSKTIRHFFSAEIVVFFSRCFLASSLLCRINCHYIDFSPACARFLLNVGWEKELLFFMVSAHVQHSFGVMMKNALRNYYLPFSMWCDFLPVSCDLSILLALSSTTVDSCMHDFFFSMLFLANVLF